MSLHLLGSSLILGLSMIGLSVSASNVSIASTQKGFQTIDNDERPWGAQYGYHGFGQPQWGYPSNSFASPSPVMREQRVFGPRSPIAPKPARKTNIFGQGGIEPSPPSGYIGALPSRQNINYFRQPRSNAPWGRPPVNRSVEDVPERWRWANGPRGTFSDINRPNPYMGGYEYPNPPW